MSQQMEDTVKQIMSDILDMEAESITDDTSMENVELWDSSNHISMVLALEEEFGISLDVSEIEEMISFYDIMSVIQEKA